MPRNLHPFPWREVHVDLPFGCLDFLLHPAHFGVDIHIMFAAVRADIRKLFFEFDDRFFEIERLDLHWSGDKIG
jgi:hypothetical protein